MTELTRVQRLTLDFIADHIDQRGFPPSVKDISREFGMLSTNAVSDRLKALERKGLIARRARIARGIVLTQLGLEKAGRLSPDRIRTANSRTPSTTTRQRPCADVASTAEKETNE